MGNAFKNFLFMHARSYDAGGFNEQISVKWKKELLLAMHKGFSFANSSIQK